MSRSQGSFEFFVGSAPLFRAYLTDLVYIWHKCKSSRWHRLFEMKVMLVIRSFCRIRSEASSLFGWITYRFPSLTSSFFDRITPYVVCIKHRRGQCAVHNFQDESSKVKVEVSILSTPWPPPYFTESLHSWHRYNTWMGDVSCYFSAGRD